MPKVELSKEEIQKYKAAFDMIDRDGEGSISAKELHRAMKNFGNEKSLKEVKEMLSEFDSDHSGEVNFEEFVLFIQKTQEEDAGDEQQNEKTAQEKEEDEILKAFQTFDKSGDGYLSCNEFRHILMNLGNQFTSKEVDEIFREADVNRDGHIDYKEFIAFWRNV